MSAVTICIAAFAGFAVLMLIWRYYDQKAQEKRRGWRVRFVTGGQWSYEERKEEGWLGIPLLEIGDHRESPHIIGVPEPEDWRRFPSWAADRRDEILARVKSELRSPQYVLKGA